MVSSNAGRYFSRGIFAIDFAQLCCQVLPTVIVVIDIIFRKSCEVDSHYRHHFSECRVKSTINCEILTVLPNVVLSRQ